MKRRNMIILVSLILVATLAGCGKSTAVIAPKPNMSMDGISAFDDSIQRKSADAESIDEPYIRSFVLYAVPEYEYSAKVINPGNPFIMEVRTIVPGWNFCSAEFTVLADGKELITNTEMIDDDLCERVIYDSEGREVENSSCATTTSMVFALNSVDVDISDKNISVRVAAAYTDNTGYEADEIVQEMNVEAKVESEDELTPVRVLSGKSFVEINSEWYQVEVDNEVKRVPHGSCMYICRELHFVPFSKDAEISSIYKPTVTLAGKESGEKINLPESIGITRTFDEKTNILSVIVNPYIASENENAEVLVKENYILLQWSDGTSAAIEN